MWQLRWVSNITLTIWAAFLNPILLFHRITELLKFKKTFKIIKSKYQPSTFIIIHVKTFLSTSRDGDLTTCPCSPLQYFTTFTMKNKNLNIETKPNLNLWLKLTACRATQVQCTQEETVAALFLSKFQWLSVSGQALGSYFAPLLSSNEVTHHWLPWASVSWGKWFSSLLYWLKMEQPSVLCYVPGGTESPTGSQSFYPQIPTCNPAVASKPRLLGRQNLIISGHSKAFRNILNCILWAGLQCQVICISDSAV